MPTSQKQIELSLYLREQRESILLEWVETLRPGIERPARESPADGALRDHIAQLLEDLCAQLGVPLTQESEKAALSHAERHGDARWTERYQLTEVLKEIASLRTVLIAKVVLYTHTRFSADEASIANKLIHRFFDAFLADSASYFAALAQDASTERERNQLAQELHDGACQLLQATVLRVQLLIRKLLEPSLQQEMRDIQSNIRRAAEDVRRIAHGLSPLPVELSKGLGAALEVLARETTNLLPCEFQGEISSGAPSGLALQLYRIAQEAITNALKHSGAEKIVIHLFQRSDELTLRVSDNGRGLADPEEKKGIGFFNMRNRARVLGGELQFEGAVGQGLSVVCTVPLGTTRVPRPCE